MRHVEDFSRHRRAVRLHKGQAVIGHTVPVIHPHYQAWATTRRGVMSEEVYDAQDDAKHALRESVKASPAAPSSSHSSEPSPLSSAHRLMS